jgi:transposase
MDQDTTFVGLDVHKASISVAVAEPERGEVRALGTIPNTSDAVEKLVRRLGPASHLSFCYEAGPCGYGLHRHLTRVGATCIVAAPSLIPRKPGERIKTDRRDALNLARLLRRGDLTPVWVPDEAHEALRDLSRARHDAQVDLLRHRHQLGKFLLRRDLFPVQRLRRWGKMHRAWLQSLHLTHASHQIVLRDYLETVDRAEERLANLEAELALAATQNPLAPLIVALQAFRGIALTTAIILVAELGDPRRFPSARDLMGYTGLVSTEDSSGERRHRGRITKTGNAYVRHVLVEAAWQYRRAPGVWGALKKRQAGLPPAVVAISWKAQQRLHRRFRRLIHRGKLPQVAVVAIARELAGFLWAAARAVPTPVQKVAA